MSKYIEVPTFIIEGVFSQPVNGPVYIPDINKHTGALEYYRQALQMMESAEAYLEEICGGEFAKFSAEQFARQMSGNKEEVKASFIKDEGEIKLLVEQCETLPEQVECKPLEEPKTLTFKGLPPNLQKDPTVRFVGIPDKPKEEGTPIPQVNLRDPKPPKPKQFKEALLKILGQKTCNTEDVWVLSDEVIVPVLKEVGIDPDNSPWPINSYNDPETGKRVIQTLRRNITYAYRNSKEGYLKEGEALFRSSGKSRAWALTEYGARLAETYNPLTTEEINKKEELKSNNDMDKIFYEVIPSEENRTIQWINEQGPELLDKLVKHSARFGISRTIGILEDHTNEFLCDLIKTDKIGRWSDRKNGQAPTLGHIKGWLTNHISDQLEKNAREPICRAIHGAETKALRKAKKELMTHGDVDLAANNEPSFTCVVKSGNGDVSSTNFFVRRDKDSNDEEKTFFNTKSELDTMSGEIDRVAMIREILSKFSKTERAQAGIILEKLSNGYNLTDVKGVVDFNVDKILLKLQNYAAKFAHCNDMKHLLPRGVRKQLAREDQHKRFRSTLKYDKPKGSFESYSI